MDRYTATDFVQEQASQTEVGHSHRFPSNHDHRVNDEMWLNGLAYQQLSRRFCQINQNLNVANATCTHLQNDLAIRKEELVEVKGLYKIADSSLQHEFKCHKETEKSLDHERYVTRGLVSLLNTINIPESSKSAFLPPNLQLGVIFRENLEMRGNLYDSNDEIKRLKDALASKQESIKTLEAEYSSKVAELEENLREIKSEFLNIMSEGDDISIEMATVGKRKRASICSVGGAE